MRPSMAHSAAADLQCAHGVLLVRPACFGYNAQTAANNRFQQPAQHPDTAERARSEFAALATGIEGAGVRVCVVEDSAEPIKPDAVFPNNWVSFHSDGTVVLYPMHARNRRLERRTDVLAAVERELPFRCRHLLDLTAEELRGRCLEGTGSLVFDAVGRDGTPIYHTNVMLAIGSRCALLCSDSVSKGDRDRVQARLRASGRRLIEISLPAMYAFAANVLELRAASPAGAAES